VAKNKNGNGKDSTGGPDSPSTVDVQEAQLPEATASEGQVSGSGIDILLDAPMLVEVSLGRIEMEVRDLLRLGEGSVVKLDKRAGEPVDILVRGCRFASGSLVVVGDRLGVRIRNISDAETDSDESSREAPDEQAESS